MKNLLLLACYFPPYGGMGAQRALKFVKYLPQNGWLPTILTVKEKKLKNISPTREEFYKPRDPHLLKDIPSKVKVYRTLKLEPTLFLKNILFKGAKKVSPKLEHKIIKKKRNLIFKYLRTFIDLPDHEIGWLPFAFWKGLKIIKKKNIDLIFTTSPPHSIHLIGYLLKYFTKKSWIIDFRDPWTKEVWFNPATELRRKIEEFLEETVLNYADMVICNTEPMKRDFMDSYPNIDPEKFVVITNGFDKDDFKGLERKERRKFTITYTGTMCISFDEKESIRYNPLYFFKALKRLIEERPELEDKIEVIFAVYIREEIDLPKLIKELGLQKVLKIYQFLPHKECMEHLVNSDLLLLLHHKGPQSKDWVPAKLYEYLGAERPILALIPKEPGAASKILEETKSAVMVSPDNIDEIKEAIYNIYLRHQNKSFYFEINREEVYKYERGNLTKRLSRVLDSLIREC